MYSVEMGGRTVVRTTWEITLVARYIEDCALLFFGSAIVPSAMSLFRISSFDSRVKVSYLDRNVTLSVSSCESLVFVCSLDTREEQRMQEKNVIGSREDV